ncbi:MAG: ABC transporter ATP-binding protein [Peptococcaceae bacterium]|nr:ABC transporter ATP-binding protein [Peptococcaceae bacterium]
MAGEQLKVVDASKTFYTEWGKVEVLRSVSLTAARGEFLSVVGVSGCGKTTLLRIIAGLEQPSGGEVFCNGVRVSGPGSDRAVVFQEPRLFPWLNVEQNIAFGLKQRNEAARRVVEQALELVGLSAFRQAYPHELSGGMAQRVAMARALAFEPEALLMDEPFSALDAQTRTHMQSELQEIWRRTGKTILLVTHSIAEALLLSQRICIMTSAPGRFREVVEVDLPYPRDPDAPEFIRLKKYILTQLTA